MRLVARVTLLLAFGCDGDARDACNGQDPIDTITQLSQYRCSALNAGLDTDPDSPDFGTATCSVLDGQFAAEHPQFCDCTEEGYAPLSDDDANAARDRARQDGWCQDACCLELCFCELQQLTGDDRLSCQQDGVRGSHNGWCYVAPKQGVGTLQAIARSNLSEAKCDDPQAIVYTGDYLDGIRFVSCWR